jgi:hypothetical protein
MTKKILIISYFFNQKEQIGSVRLRGLAKYLPELGWEPTILTIKSPNNSPDIDNNFRVVETDYSDLMTVWKSRLGFSLEEDVQDQLNLSSNNKKGFIDFLINKWKEIFAYPDTEKNWYKPAVEAGDQLLKNEKFDLILSSSYPFTCHLIGNELKKRHKIPWVADLRDLWTQNHDYPYSFLRKIVDKSLEKKVFSNADALTTVSVPWTNKLKNLTNKENIYTILNGFDPELLNHDEELDKKFSIVYTGRIYEGKMDPEPLFAALKELTTEDINKNDVSVDFYGINVGILGSCPDKYDLKQVINIHNLIPHQEVIEKQRRAQLLLLLNWNDPNETGVYTGKIFEYLSAKRPIIAIGGYGGVIDELFKKTSSGMSLSDKEQIKTVLKRYYAEFKSDKGIEYHGDLEEINKYSQLEMAKNFSKIFETLIPDL